MGTGFEMICQGFEVRYLSRACKTLCPPTLDLQLESLYEGLDSELTGLYRLFVFGGTYYIIGRDTLGNLFILFLQQGRGTDFCEGCGRRLIDKRLCLLPYERTEALSAKSAMDVEEQKFLIEEREKEDVESVQDNEKRYYSRIQKLRDNWIATFAVIYGIVTTLILAHLYVSNSKALSVPYSEYQGRYRCCKELTAFSSNKPSPRTSDSRCIPQRALHIFKRAIRQA
jgi:hypothetical protein